MAGTWTHTQVYEAIRDAIVAEGDYTQDPRLLGNRQSPSPIKAGGFRINPTGYEDTRAFRRRRGASEARIRETITVHLTDPMDSRQETSWTTARANANAAVAAVYGTGLQLIDALTVETVLSDSGNYIEHDLTFTVVYDLDVS